MPYCPTCNRPVDWVPQYGQYWCHACQRYYPRAIDSLDSFFNELDHGSAPPACAYCGARLDFIHAYQRWYCPRCQQYR